MPRKKREYPVPNLERRGEFYHIRWKWEGVTYRISIGRKTELVAKELLARAGLALQDAEPWPPSLVNSATVSRWIRRNLSRKEDITLLAEYSKFLATEKLSENWRKTLLSYARAFCAQFPEPWRVEVKDAYSFFGDMTAGQAEGTRNKKLQAMSRLFKWMMITRRAAFNPFADLKYRKERDKRNDMIVYLGRRERAYMMAKARKDKHGAAAWLAVCLGLRRKEAWFARWTDINWDNETLHVPESKNAKARTIPMPTPLIQYLAPLRRRKGTIVDWDEKEQVYETQATQLSCRLVKACKCLDPDHVGFNPFRHTFATHLILAGVSLSKIAYYLGDTEETARKHYARFVPKDSDGREVDKGF